MPYRIERREIADRNHVTTAEIQPADVTGVDKVVGMLINPDGSDAQQLFPYRNLDLFVVEGLNRLSGSHVYLGSGLRTRTPLHAKVRPDKEGGMKKS